MTFKKLLAFFWSGSICAASGCIFADKTICWATWDSGLAGLTAEGWRFSSPSETLGMSSSSSSFLVKVFGLQTTRNHLWSTPTGKGFIGKISGSSEFMGGWGMALRTGQEFKEAELAGMRANIGLWNSLDRVSLLLPPLARTGPWAPSLAQLPLPFLLQFLF